MSQLSKDDTLEQNAKSFAEIEHIIARAIKKAGVRKENDLCRFIPMETGGYMHHFTLKKMKTKQPRELSRLIEKFIIDSDKIHSVAPKQRAARGSRKKRDQIAFTRQQLEKMLNMAKLAGDKEMVCVLSPRRSITSCKKELISSIRQGRVEQDLWDAYVESMQVTAPALV